MNGNRGYSCLSCGVICDTDALRAFYTTAQKAKGAILRFWASGIIEIDHQNDVFQIPLQKAVCVSSRMSF